jgi:hypothetical protein
VTVVRNVFPLTFGHAREAHTLANEGISINARHGLGGSSISSSIWFFAELCASLRP